MGSISPRFHAFVALVALATGTVADSSRAFAQDMTNPNAKPSPLPLAAPSIPPLALPSGAPVPDTAIPAPSLKERIESEEADVPKKPSAPPNLGVVKSPPEDSFQCARRYVYRGKTLNCDSNLGWDGENLRPIIHDTPQAVAELDTYQSNRKKVQTLQYVGSAGFILIGAGFILSRVLASTNPDRIPLRNLGIIGGSVMIGGSLTWGLTLLKTNEAHLGKAVDAHNKAFPKDPIELQFSTGIHF